jgi:hypothetical protein
MHLGTLATKISLCMNLIGSDWLSIYLFASLLASPILAIIGSKKRLGFGWSLLFTLFPGILFGILFVILSPSKKNLPIPNESEILHNRLFGILFLVIGSLLLYGVYNSVSTSYDSSFAGTLGAVSPGLISLTEASYFFYRYDRHKRLYEKYVLGLKKLVDKDVPNGMPPPNGDLDVPIYDQAVK